jgi:Na+-driven multidrug efflux pump
MRGLGRDLRDAIRGTGQDYTQGSIGRAILLLSVPMMLEMVLESVFAVVDVYFVAALGASAIATVGLTEAVLTLIYAVAIGLSMGTTALVSRRIGEKNPHAAAEAAVQAILVALAACVPFSIAGMVFAKDLLGLMGADAWSIEHGYRYMAWMLGGNVVIMLIFVINAVFRGAGDAAIAMRVLWLSNGINLVLDPLLIFGWGIVPAMGIEGAAIATNIGRGIGVVAQLWVLFRGGKHIRVLFSQVRIFTSDPAVVRVGAECLRVVSYGYIFYAWGMVMPQAFNGAGDTMTPTRINFFLFWLFEIPLAYVLAMPLGLRASGVFWSIVFAESLAGLVGIWLFRRGNWKRVQV